MVGGATVSRPAQGWDKALTLCLSGGAGGSSAAKQLSLSVNLRSLGSERLTDVVPRARQQAADGEASAANITAFLAITPFFSHHRKNLHSPVSSFTFL